jgi:hypothetical protein
MADDLKGWERDRPRGTPELVFIAAGSAEANLAIGLRSRVLLDPTFAVSQVFGSAGTPSAIVIDADGRVASDLRVGAKEIFVLAGRTTEGRVAEAVI